jgi:hypothetical protein
MSSEYVREQFRTLLAGALPPPWQWLDSINRAEAREDLPPQWFSVQFNTAQDDPISLGRPALWRETGAPLVVLFTEQQIGDAIALEAAELLRAAVLHFVDVTGHMRILACSPPVEIDGGDFRGAWYRQGVEVRYQFDRLA